MMRQAFMSEAAYLLAQAERCRRLAAGVDHQHTRETLREMADEYERRAADLVNPIPPSSD
jgi:hypothetical protein